MTAEVMGQERRPAAPPPSAEPAYAGAVEEIVVTGTRTPRPRTEAPVATEVVTREEIAARGAATVHEALRDQLGLDSNPSFYGPHATRVQMMGLDGSHVLVMVDGLRLVGESGGAIDLRRLPVDLVERIEIVKGPMSSLYGTDALGGVINVVTRREPRAGVHGGAVAELRAVPGSLAGGRRLSGDLAWAGRGGGVQAGAVYQQLPAYDLVPGDQTLTGPRRQEVSGNLAGQVRVGDRARVEGGVELLRSLAVGRLEQSYPGLPATLVDLPDSFWRLRSHAAVALDDPAQGRLQLRVANTYFSGASDKDRRDSPLDEHRRRWHDLAVAELVWTRPVRERQTVTVGVQASGEWFRQHLTVMELAGGGAGVAAVDVLEVPRRRLLSEEAYLQDEIRVGWVVLAPGLRYLHHHAFGQQLAPKLAVVFTPHQRLTLRGQVGRGFRAPAAPELAFNFDHAFYGYRVVGNPGLRPEGSWGTQGGAELRLPLGLGLEGLLYRNWLENLIVTELDPGQSTPALSVFRYRNVGRAHTAGAEVSLTWQPSPRFRAQGGYAHVRAVDDATGLSVPGRPPHTLQGALSSTAPVSQTRVDLRARWSARTLAARPDAPAAAEPAERWSPAFATVDLRVAQPLERLLGWATAAERLEVYAGLENLLDRRRDPADPADLAPEAGRVVYAGVRGRR